MRDLPPLASIRVFDAAARHQNLSRAAEELNMTQSAVSYQIKQIEAFVGAPLFVREARGVRLNARGEQLAPMVQAALASLSRAFRAVSDKAHSVLTISTMQTIAGNWLAPRIGSFQMLHPEFAVRLDISSGLADFAVDGIDVVRSGRQARGRMGVLSDARGLYPRLTARENIVYYGRLQGLSADAAGARAEELARTLDLQPLMDRRTDGFSQGERMKTALARALVHDPPNIVLDEPTNGLDVVATRALRETLRRLRDEQGKCIVFSTHIMQEVERLCDQVVVVAGGRSVAHGSVEQLLAQTGERDFEEAFVALAYGRDEAVPRTPA